MNTRQPADQGCPPSAAPGVEADPNHEACKEDAAGEPDDGGAQERPAQKPDQDCRCDQVLWPAAVRLPL